MPRPIRRTSTAALYLGLALLVVAVATLGLSSGAYTVSPLEVLKILLARLVPMTPTWSAGSETVVLDVRLPRVLLGLLVGGALALSGAVLQAVFRNPIVNPQIIGVSSGASFGGVLAIVLGLNAVALMGSAFVFGMVSLFTVFAVSKVRGPTPALMIILAGVVVGALFSALVSLVTYIADPYSELQSLVFWLLGSVATATNGEVLLVAGPILAGCLLVLALRWRLNVLSLGDEDAASLGMRPGVLRWVLLVTVGAMVAAAVSASGVIGWVGLVVPHLARMLVGPDHKVLLPVCVLLGGAYLSLIDTLTRLLLPGEVPIGVLTAVLGAPVFLVLLRRTQTRSWADA